MTGTQDVLDLDRVRKLFDLASSTNAHNGGNYREDPYPVWQALREEATVHEGTVHELSGVQQHFMFHGLPYPDRPHFSTFSWAACDAAYRNPETFASSPDAVDLEGGEIGPHQQHVVDGRGTASALPGPGPTVVLADEGIVVGRELDRSHRQRADRCLRGPGSRRAERGVLRGHPGPHDHRELRRAGGPGSRHSRIAGPARADGGDPRTDRRGPPRAARGRPDQCPRGVRNLRTKTVGPTA